MLILLKLCLIVCIIGTVGCLLDTQKYIVSVRIRYMKDLSFLGHSSLFVYYFWVVGEHKIYGCYITSCTFEGTLVCTGNIQERQISRKGYNVNKTSKSF